MVNFDVSHLHGLASQPKKVDQLCRDARTMLRLIGPRVSAAMDDRGTFGHCNICTPPPKVYECVLCGYTTGERWLYRMHIEGDNKMCRRTAERTAKKWANS